MTIRRGPIVAVHAATFLAGVALLAPAGALAQKAPIKVGVMLPLTGLFSTNGQETLDALRLYFDEVGGQAAGRKIELIVEDSQGKPDVGVTKARKLVEGDKVHLLTGIVSTAVALAINEYVREKKVPLVISADAGANQLTMPGKFLNPYLVRVSQNGRTPSAAAADWGYKQGWRRGSGLASDYAGGLAVAGCLAPGGSEARGRGVGGARPPAAAGVDAGLAVDRNVEDTDKFIAALKRIKFPSPKGDITLDEYGQVIQSMYVRKVEKVGPEYVNAVVATYHPVDQFWPYSAKEY